MNKLENEKIIQHIRLIQYDLEFMEFYLIYSIEHMKILLSITDDDEIRQISNLLNQLYSSLKILLDKKWDTLVENYGKEESEI